MKRFFALCLTCLLAISLLASCGSSSGDYAGVDGGLNSIGSSSTVDFSTKDEMSVADSDYNVEETRTDIKLVYTGDVDLETVKFDETIIALETLVSDYDAYFQEKDIHMRTSGWDSDSYREADMTIRVPAAKFDDMMVAIASFGDAVVVRSNISTEDITEAYYDVETRLTSAKARLAQLQELLTRASDIDDIISIQKELADATYDIEYLQGRINRFESRIQYSYINLDLKEVTALTMTAKAVGYGSKLAESFVSGFLNGIEFFGSLLLMIVGNWLVFGVIAAVVVIIVKVNKKRKAKNPKKRIATAMPTRKKDDSMQKISGNPDLHE